MKTFLTVSAFALVLASSCSGAASKQEVQSIAVPPADPGGAAADGINASTASPGLPGSPDQEKKEEQQKPAGHTPVPPPRAEWNKKIIKNARLELEVKDFKSFTSQMNAIAGKYGGYIAEEDLQSNDYKLESKAVIRIPAEQFETAVTELSGNAQKILTRNITSKDVTGEVVDIRSRLEAKRQARLRYLELMKQAKDMEEVFQVQQEVDEIQEEMEAAAGRVEYLNHASVYSTIELTYFQVLDAALLKDNNKEPSFGSRVLVAFREGFKWVGDLLVLLVTLWPLIPGVLALIWGLKRFARNNKAKATANTAAEPVKS